MTAAAAQPAPAGRLRSGASWALASGAEIAPGLKALRILGGGTLYEVYRAWDERRLATVVCKLVRPDQVGEGRALRQLRRESALLARLVHPALVRSLGALLEEPRPHLVLEHGGKVTLRRWLRLRGPLPLDQLLPLARDLSAALHYLAAQRVVHLDLKPANVLLGAPPRLIDFSLARTLEDAQRLQRPVGTTRYMAPEQCLPGLRGTVGPAADIWGLGVTLYEAVTGRLPFRSDSPANAMEPVDRYPQLSTEPRPIQTTVPGALATLLLRCLRPEPTARPTAGAFLSELVSIAASLPGGSGEDWPAMAPT